MVVNAGFENTRASLYELADQSIDSEVKELVRTQAQRGLAQVEYGHEAELRRVTGVKSGQNYLIDLEVAVPGPWSVDRISNLETVLRAQVGGRVRGARRVRVRFVSSHGPAKEPFDEFIPGSVPVQPDAGSEEAHTTARPARREEDDNEPKHRH